MLYADEEVNYYFEEIRENDSVSTEKAKLRNHRRKREGKYGKLNAMIRMSPARRKQAMLDFEEEELMAQKLFKKMCIRDRKWIVEAHGGTIRAESRLGEGTRFIFEIPK